MEAGSRYVRHNADQWHTRSGHRDARPREAPPRVIPWSTAPSRCWCLRRPAPLDDAGELARRSGIPTTPRCGGRAAGAWGALERDAEGRYSIGLRLWEVASSLAPARRGSSRWPCRSWATSEEVTRQHVLLAVRDGDQGLLVERLSSHLAMPVLYRVGGRLPLHSTTGVGLVCWPTPSPSSRRRCSAGPWCTSPRRSRCPPALRRTLAAIRQDGLHVLRAPPRPAAAGQRRRPGVRPRRPGRRGAVGRRPAGARRARLLGPRRPHRRPGHLPRPRRPSLDRPRRTLSRASRSMAEVWGGRHRVPQGRGHRRPEELPCPSTRPRPRGSPCSTG